MQKYRRQEEHLAVAGEEQAAQSSGFSVRFSSVVGLVAAVDVEVAVERVPKRSMFLAVDAVDRRWSSSPRTATRPAMS